MRVSVGVLSAVFSAGALLSTAPGLKGLHAKYQDRPFVIVGVSLDYEMAPLRAHVNDNDMAWPQYVDRNRAIMRLFGIGPVPTYVLIDHEGIVRDTRAGWSSSVDGWLDARVSKYLRAIPQ